MEVAASRLPDRRLLHRYRSGLRCAPPFHSRSRERAPSSCGFFPVPAGLRGAPGSELPGGRFAPSRSSRRVRRDDAAGFPAHRVELPVPLGVSPLLETTRPERARCCASWLPSFSSAGGGSSPPPSDSRPVHRRSGARSELDLPRDSFAGCLSSGSRAARPLPGVAPLRNCGATRNSRSALVVPAHLDGFLRAADAGVLQPAPDEVRRVSVGGSVPARSVSRSSRGRSLPTSPRRTSHPSKNPRPEHSRAQAAHPPKQPFRVTAIVAPVPFSRLRGFAPLRGPAFTAPPLPARRE